MIDIIGKTFGRLTVIERRENTVHNKATFLCRCICGGEKIIIGANLKKGDTKSCGCLSKEHMSVLGSSRKIHGKRATATYTAWNNMKSRCDNPAHDYYHRYGGRGISYCPEWAIFSAFLKDMGEKPLGLTLDRVDNDKGYTKSNCRWATQSQQARNRTNTNLIRYNGVTKCLTDWAEHLRMNRGTLSDRLHSGWSVQKAFTTPVKVRVAPS